MWCQEIAMFNRYGVLSNTLCTSKCVLIEATFSWDDQKSHEPQTCRPLEGPTIFQTQTLSSSCTQWYTSPCQSNCSLLSLASRADTLIAIKLRSVCLQRFITFPWHSSSCLRLLFRTYDTSSRYRRRRHAKSKPGRGYLDCVSWQMHQKPSLYRARLNFERGIPLQIGRTHRSVEYSQWWYNSPERLRRREDKKRAWRFVGAALVGDVQESEWCSANYGQ